MSHIILNDVSKIYNRGQPDEKVALDHVNLNIPQGGYYTFSGASGSGKSTLLNIIGLMDTPTAGSYMLNGVDMSMAKDHIRARVRNQNIGFIFQNFGLIEDRNVVENVMTPILFDSSISLREGQLMAMEALSQVGLEDMYKKRVTRLSGGERQRVAIARAIVKKHDIILADEPTGQLDVSTATSIMELLIDLNKQGTTLLVVTHNSEVAQMCPNRVMIRDGKLMMV